MLARAVGTASDIAREAGAAERVDAGARGRRLEALEREVSELVAPIASRTPSTVRARRSSPPPRQVDPVEARRDDRRRRDADVHLGGACSKSICTTWRVVEPRTIESSTTTSRLPATSASGLYFIRIPWSRMPCSGWMNVRPT